MLNYKSQKIIARDIIFTTFQFNFPFFSEFMPNNKTVIMAYQTFVQLPVLIMPAFCLFVAGRVWWSTSLVYSRHISCTLLLQGDCVDDTLFYHPRQRPACSPQVRHIMYRGILPRRGGKLRSGVVCPQV